jgi:NAD(P)-binding Rossmann-like domain
VKICVIGSGIAGLTTALHLSQDAAVSITVYERSGQLGGRADVAQDGEHCPRSDESLIAPRVARLRARGVDLRTDTAVIAIGPQPWAVTVRTAEGAAEFDAVVVTAFVPDLVALLHASRIGHSVFENGHTHCVAYTLDLDPREAVLAAPGPGLYCREGISMHVQAQRLRCVVLCVTSKSTEARIILPKVREFLGLEHDFVRVGMRLDGHSRESVLVGEYLCPDRILRRPAQRVYFAGSAIHSSYLVDSAEDAVRSALAATAQIRRDLGLPAARTAGPTVEHATGNEEVCIVESH